MTEHLPGHLQVELTQRAGHAELIVYEMFLKVRKAATQASKEKGCGAVRSSYDLPSRGMVLSVTDSFCEFHTAI